MNKRLRAIYAEAGLNYGEDVSETDLPARFKTALNFRKKNVKQILRNIRLARNVELCFMVDATGSMRNYINGVRDSISKIIDLLKSANPNPTRDAMKLRLSFVAYRDFKDVNHFEVLDFTDSIENFKEFCAKLRAKGGGDTPEDVFGAFEEAFKLSWSDDFGTKVIFHIADAPCHGKKYHDARDRYPAGDPSNRDETQIFNQICERNIDYYFGKIDRITDKMIGFFF